MVNALVIFASALAALSSAKATATPEARDTAVQCPQAARFGGLFGLPATLTTGQSITVTHNYTCSFAFGIVPTFTDYLLEVTANGNGFQPPILVARRTPQVTAAQPEDTFTFTVPFAFFFAPASYSLTTVTTFPTSGTNGSPVLQQGGILNGVQIIDTSAQ
ncbi:hypothetical protein B0H34DRAFT_795484 [Crassisporium funariophilum]|nr:hypothetical protein B0H34DRAFT_795484 [Crassisporium funariophilum]